MKQLIGILLSIILVMGSTLTVVASDNSVVADTPALQDLFKVDKECGYLGLVVRNNTVTGKADETPHKFIDHMILGVYVEDILEGSPASLVGLNKGDLITAINDKSVKTVKDLKDYLRETEPYEEITLTITLLNDKGYIKEITYTTTTVGYDITNNQMFIKGYNVL